MTEAIRQGDIPGVQLRCRRELGADVETVWRHLTQPEGLEGWLCDSARPTEDGWEWSGGPEVDAGTREIVRVIASESSRRIVTTLHQPTWSAATRLEFELIPSPDGCELSVLQNGFEHLPLSDSLTVWEAYRRRWRAALERLAALGG